jgi:hypothetical protein
MGTVLVVQFLPNLSQENRPSGSSGFSPQKSQIHYNGPGLIVRENSIFHLATFLRWYNPDQVQRVKKRIVFLSARVSGHP